MLQLFQVEQDLGQFRLDGRLIDVQFLRRVLDERRPVTGRVQVERVDVYAVPERRDPQPGDHQVHLEPFVTELFIQAPHPPAAVVDPDDHFAVRLFDVQVPLWWRHDWGRGGCVVVRPYRGLGLVDQVPGSHRMARLDCFWPSR